MLTLLFLALIIMTVVYWLGSVLPFKICAICAGVSGAWLLATLGILLGFVSLNDYRLPILMLMGGTAVGIAFQGQEKLAFAKKNIWRWKVPSTLIGLGIFYWFFTNMGWLTFAAEAGLLGFLIFVFFIRKNEIVHGVTEKTSNQGIKEKLEECC
jgi:hypothetical protein